MRLAGLVPAKSDKEVGSGPFALRHTNGMPSATTVAPCSSEQKPANGSLTAWLRPEDYWSGLILLCVLSISLFGIFKRRRDNRLVGHALFSATAAVASLKPDDVFLDDNQTRLEKARAPGACIDPSAIVHVADPGRISFQQMCANIAINGLSNVHTHPHWLGHSEDQVLPALLHHALLHQHAQEIVQVKTLDSMGLESLNLIKINVAGALNALLAGAVETIRKHRPVIYARLGGIEQAALEVQTLKELGYRCWSHAPYVYQRENHAQQATNIFPGCVLQNVVASPVESRFEREPHLEL